MFDFSKVQVEALKTLWKKNADKTNAQNAKMMPTVEETTDSYLFTTDGFVLYCIPKELFFIKEEHCKHCNGKLTNVISKVMSNQITYRETGDLKQNKEDKRTFYIRLASEDGDNSCWVNEKFLDLFDGVKNRILKSFGSTNLVLVYSGDMLIGGVMPVSI